LRQVFGILFAAGKPQSGAVNRREYPLCQLLKSLALIAPCKEHGEGECTFRALQQRDYLGSSHAKLNRTIARSALDCGGPAPLSNDLRLHSSFVLRFRFSSFVSAVSYCVKDRSMKRGMKSLIPIVFILALFGAPLANAQEGGNARAKEDINAFMK